MKRIYKISAVLIFVLMILTLSNVLPITADAYSLKNGEKVYSIATDRIMYETSRAYDETINTFEAWITLPSTVADNIDGGVIFGNYYNTPTGYPGCVNYGVGTNGNFYLYWNNGAYKYTFRNVDLRTDERTHVAIVRDKDNSLLLYYVNGELEESVSVDLSESVCQMKFGIGTDWNNWYNEKTPFFGQIEQITLYSTAQTQSVIQDDMKTKDIRSASRDGLMSNWYFGKNWTFDNALVADTSDVGNDCRVNTYDQYVAVEEVDDYDYTLMVVPDMQAMNFWEKNNFRQQSQWIVNTAKKLNTRFVMYLGDMTESKYSSAPEASEQEWKDASSYISMLDGVVPYSVILGNHDYDNWTSLNRNTTMFNKYFPYDKYSKTSTFGGAFKEGSMDNYYSILSIGDVEYLIFSVEYGPRNNVVNWVDRIISEHPNSRVIVTTHSYLDPDGTLVGSNDMFAPSRTISYDSVNNGEDFWEKVLSKHSNVFMVFSGHVCTDYVVRRQDLGVNGNTVTSVLVNAQGAMMTSAMNTLLVIKVNEKTKTMHFCYYSPEYDACYNYGSQFSMSFADEHNPAIGGIE